MKKVHVAFQTHKEGEAVPPTFQEICCHLIFNVKMEDFR
jgi:hypothetical protein